jgi:ubiquinone/menaquinone biosynthesis C-methylase UbiE
VDNQLDRIRKAYDLTVEQYRSGIEALDNIPEKIKNSPFFKSLSADSDLINSSAIDIKKYLAPEPGMRFLDAGCCANLANYRLDKWPSTYYGFDISPALINAMRDFVKRQNISVGGLEVADFSKLPFDDNFFDIAAVIGLLEYCTLEYIGIALTELHRVLKTGARAVLDIPNRDHSHVNDMLELEKYLGRPIFLHPRLKFEELLAPLFATVQIDDSRVMIKYFVRAIK